MDDFKTRHAADARDSRDLPYWSYWLLIILVFGSLAAIMLLDPIAQDPNYHRFADQRSLFGIPNWQNVLSNIPFLFVGVLGLIYVIRWPQRGARWSWLAFSLGVYLVCFGSTYYHWAPDKQTLIWDRLSMTLAFMGIFVALLSETVNSKLEKYLLLPALSLGFFSVYYWNQVDDLRLYIWVQMIPLITIPFLLLRFHGSYTHRHYLAYALVCYVLAKVVEFTDGAVFSLTQQFISGHALKHLLAALGSWYIVDMVRKRTPIPETASA